MPRRKKPAAPAPKPAPKPVIGINGDYRGPKADSSLPALSWFNAGYFDTVTKGGGLPTLVPPMMDDEDLRQYLGMLDGIVLSGGPLDLDPGRQGVDRHPATRTMAVRREDFDRRLAAMAIEMKLPILAIGAGMQLLNVMMGGTLHQHLPEDNPNGLPHRDGCEANNRHLLEPVAGTRVEAAYGNGEIRVNSLHHMAVDAVAPEFVASAHAPDGVVEAIETRDENWYCVGVQWHPENETASALDMQLIDSFLTACKESSPAVLPMSRGLRIAA